MAIEINVGNKANINVQTAADSADVESSNVKTSSKILDGKSLTVTSGAMTDLEKLVAQLKNETDETRMSVTQQRISVLQTVLDTMSDRITEIRNRLVRSCDVDDHDHAEIPVEDGLRHIDDVGSCSCDRSGYLSEDTDFVFSDYGDDCFDCIHSITSIVFR